MTNNSISINTLVAWLLWAGGIACSAVDLIFGLGGVGRLAILFVAAGATLHIRGMICARDAREHAAYQMGREAALRSIR